MKLKDKIIFDSETTGLLEPDAIDLDKQPYITELFALRLDSKNKVIGEYESFFSVPVEIPKHIVKLTGITPSMLDGAPQFIEEYKNITEFFLGARTMIAHNLPFDSGMLWCELSRIGKEFNFPWPPEHYCTIEHGMYIENKRLKLSRLLEHATGSKQKGTTHRARQDVYDLVQCYKWLIKQ